MKYCNNNIFVFSSEKETSFQVSKVLKKEYHEKQNNLIASSYEFSDAVKKLEKHYQERIYFDIFILDLRIPLGIRQEFIKIVNQNQVNYECIIATSTSALPKEEIDFIKDINAYMIPDISEITLFPLLPNVIQSKFNELKYLLVNRIDSIINSELEARDVLNRIVNLTLEYLDLRICWVALLDQQTGKFNIAAVTGFGEHEQEFRETFDVALSDKEVIAESARSQDQLQYQNVLDDQCPFKYKGLAKKMGLKSILITPVFDRRGTDLKKVLATLNLYTKTYHIFQDDEMELTRIIAAKITAALFRKGLYHPAQR